MLIRNVFLCIFISLFPTLTLSSTNITVSPAMKKAAEQITDAGIRAHIRFLASDLLDGRGPATREDKITQDYLSSELESLGIKPGAPGGGWLQSVPLVGMTSHAPDTLTFTSGTKQLTLKGFDDYVANAGVQNSKVDIKDAELIFVGYGIDAPEFQWNDFKGVDLKGKILVVMNDNPTRFAGKKRLYYGRWGYKYEQAAKLGAAGVIIIHTTPSAAYPWHVIQNSWQKESFELADEGQPHAQLHAWATDDASRKIAALGGKNLDELRAQAESRDFRPVPLGVKMSINFDTSIKNQQTANVVGVIPGSDPKLANEAIVYSAHYDHLGSITDPKNGEHIIYNGAIDNASGTAALLSIAKAFSELHMPMKRSVYFVFTAAEEQGLLGSRYFVAHSPVPANRIAANINIDGIGYYGKTKDIVLISAGKSNIDNLVAALAAMQGRVVGSDPKPESGGFYRADQFSFAKAGVPVVYFHPGMDVIGKPKSWAKEQIEKYVSDAYHQPADTYKESFDFAGAIEDTQLDFYLGVNLANAAEMPKWNKGDEFEAARYGH